MSVAWQNECHPAGRVLSSSLPLTLTLPSGKTDDTNEGWLLVSWHQTHTHCSYCATLSLLPPGSHRHRSLRKRTCSDGQRQVRNDTGWFDRMIRVFDASEPFQKLEFSTSCNAADTGIVDFFLFLNHNLEEKKLTVTVKGYCAGSGGATWLCIASAGTGKE